jgi:uncharacterized membrane protein YkoI
MLKPITTAICLCAAATALAAQTPTYNKPQTATKPAAPPQATVNRTTVKHPTKSSTKPKPKVSRAAARATALKEVPNGKVRTSKLENEGGQLIYSFDIKVPGKSGLEEVNVDAMTGAVVAHEHETPKTEATEKKKM